MQGFYDWYAPLAVKGGTPAPLDVALKDKASSFSPDLVRRLRADSLAQSRAEGEIVGLDFDPFLYSQDPDRHYRVVKVVAQDQGYLVEVHRVVAGKVDPKTTVTAVVASADGHWYFTNFDYPGGPNLLGVLTNLQQGRDKPHKATR